MKNSIYVNKFLLLPSIRRSSYFKKKSIFSDEIISTILRLEAFLDIKQESQNIKIKRFNNKKSFKHFHSLSLKRQKGPIILYSVCFTFSQVNTYLYLTDALGNLKFSFSGGLLGFKGKSKKSRYRLLKLFFRELLKKMKTSVLKNKPFALFLKNVGTYKKFIVRNLKKKLFIRMVQNYQLHPYNGCRGKKKFRK